jgi:hypothetical protein
MKTIKILAVVVIFIIAGNLHAFAQVSKEDADVIRSHYQKDKRYLVDHAMNLKSPQAEAFWKVYDAYEKDRVKLADTRIAILNDYAKHYTTLDDAQASSLVNRTFDNDQAVTALQRSYYPKFSSAVGGKNAAKFYQVDTYLQLTVRMFIQDNLPFIGELDKAKVSKK